MAITRQTPAKLQRGPKAAAESRIPRAPYLLLLPALAFALSLLIACLIVLRYSFNTWDFSTGMVSAWVLDNYVRFFSDSFYYRSFFITLQVSLVTTVIALLLGYPAAYLIAVSRHKNLLLFLVIVPLLMDVLVRAYGWIVLLSRNGLVNTTLIWLGVLQQPTQILGTETAVVLELLHEVLPFTILPLAGVLQKIDPALREAAVGLGSTKLTAFTRVTLPLSLPGVLAAVIITFALGMSAFVAPLILGAGKIFMMSIVIQQQMLLTLNWPLGSAQSVVLVVAVAALLVLYSQIQRKFPSVR